MGRNLFIRVSAVTYDEQRVEKDWPDLSDLVWPVPVNTDPTGEKLAKALGPSLRGVLELAAGTVDKVSYGELDKDRRERMLPGVKQLQGHLLALEKALGDRDVQEASRLTNSIEDTLDALEAAMRGKQS